MRWYMPCCSQRASILGSLSGRLAFMEKPVRGRFSVFFSSSGALMQAPCEYFNYIRRLRVAFAVPLRLLRALRVSAVTKENLKSMSFSKLKHGSRMPFFTLARAIRRLRGAQTESSLESNLALRLLIFYR